MSVLAPLTARGAATHGRVRTVRVALAGCGTVGGALLELMAEAHPLIARRFGVEFDVASVLVRDATRPRTGPVPRGRITTRVEDLLAAEADIVVEALGGVAPAAQLAALTLRRGATFVTANKTLLATHGPALAEIARRCGGRLSFEAAVGAGIPVIRTLRDALPWAGVHRIRGVLNGTTNFLLGRIEAGARFHDALAEAHARGFAEADPSRDLDGLDTADKVRVLAWLAFGVDPARIDVPTRGIRPDPERLVAEARAGGGVVRLVGECAAAAGGVCARVGPVVLPANSPLANVAGEENIVIIDTGWNGSIRLAGPGAGGRPTASALLGDMVTRAAAAFSAWV